MAEEWERFSERWDAALRDDPAIAYFKMSDAFALSKEFKGWTAEARDAKVDKLVDVILGTNIVYSVAVAMINMDFLAKVPQVRGTFLGDPFFFLFSNAIEACLIHQRRNGIHQKIEFIFDELNKPAPEIQRMFQQTMYTAPETIKALNLVDSPPTCRNEKIFLPLQAADLIAGQVRSFQERGDETKAIKKLGDHGFKVAYNIVDAKQFDVIVKGADNVHDYMKSGGPPGEELVRFAEIKSFIEGLYDL